MQSEGNYLHKRRFCMSSFITYEMFGAIGDGIADDMPAIMAAHEKANQLHLPVKAKEGAAYYISPRNLTAVVQTSVDWTGVKFIIDDVDCESISSPVFHVMSSEQPLPLNVKSMFYGQEQLENPFGRDLFVVVQNENHMDYIRKGLNQDNGHARTDVFILSADGSLSSPLSFDFEEITAIHAYPIDEETLTLTGGEFLTIANQAESRYTYHRRNISITRSNVEVSNITHYVTGEKDHGAPYNGFIQLLDCSRVLIHDCIFTARYIYETIGAAGLPVLMGSYDIRLDRTSDIHISRCTQTTDIHDTRYWGLIATNFCRDLLLEDCIFSRFDAHMGVSNCILRRCRLGWQCLNAIGNGTFLIEDTEAFGTAFVNLRDDYGCTWRGDIIIRNCSWLPRTEKRAVFRGSNDGTHDFGYDCYMPNVSIDGLTVLEDTTDDTPLYIFNNYLGEDICDSRAYMPIPPQWVSVKDIRTMRKIELCEKPELMAGTDYTFSGK